MLQGRGLHLDFEMLTLNIISKMCFCYNRIKKIYLPFPVINRSIERFFQETLQEEQTKTGMTD